MLHNNETKNVTLRDEFYSSYMDEGNISEKWVLMNSPIPTASVLALYYLVVLKVGPSLMKNRKPFNLKITMRIYNVLQVLYNVYIIALFFTSYSGNTPIHVLTEFSCSIPSQFEGVQQLKQLYLFIGWNFLLIKMLDLLDTVFMVMRKKYTHVTFLHLYHHGAMVFCSWFSMKYIKAVQGGIPVFININVHAVMYSYYFLATFNSFKKYLWWKRHLTKLQLAQFAVVLAYIAMLYYNSCHISTRFAIMWMVNVFIIACFFMNFYIKAYIVKPKEDVNKKKIL